MLACVLEPAFRPVVPLYIYCLVLLSESPRFTYHLYSDGSRALIFKLTPPNFQKNLPYLYVVLLLIFPITVNRVQHIPSTPASDWWAIQGVGVVLKYLLDFFSLSYPTFNSTVGSALLEYYWCLQAFNFSPSLILLLATLQIYQIWCCLRAFALT